MKKLSLFFLIMLLLPINAGCLGAVPLDAYKYVSSLGVDIGESKAYSITFLVQSEANESSTQSAAGEALVLGADGDDLFDAITTVHMGAPYQLNFERLNTIIFSKEAAEAGCLEKLGRVALNALNIRQSVKLLICLCPARTYLQGMAGAGMQNMTKLQQSLLKNYNEEGISPIINYSLVHEAAEGGRIDPVLSLGALDTSAAQAAKAESAALSSEAGEKNGEGSEKTGQEGQTSQEAEAQYTTEGVLRFGGMSIYASGAALFDRWQFAGVLNGFDTRFLLMGRGEFQRGRLQVPYGDDRLTIFLANTGLYETEMELGEVPKARVSLLFTCEVLQDDQGVSEAGWEQGLRQAVEEYLEAEISRVFAQCQALNSDAMGMGRVASRHFSTVEEWEAYNWKTKYPQMEASFHVRLTPLDENITSGLE